MVYRKMKLHRTRSFCLFMLFFFTGLAACDKKSEDQPPPPDKTGPLEIKIKTEETDILIHDAWIFVFADDVMKQYDYVDNPDHLASLGTDLPPALYTLVVVMNVGPQFFPSGSFGRSAPDGTLADFMLWLAEQAESYPELLTGMVEMDLKENEANPVTITVQKGPEGIPSSNLHLVLTLPDSSWPDYTALRAASGYTFRCVTEICVAGTGKPQLRRVTYPLAEISDNGETRYATDFSLPDGKYDVRLWTDYVPEGSEEDFHYITTEGLNAVRIVTHSYEAGGSDFSEAFYTHTEDIVMARKEQKNHVLTVPLKSPFAKYRLLSEDVEQYNLLVDKGIFPPLEELTVTVAYEGFFPTAFHVSEAKPNDAESGISYVVSSLSVATGKKEVLLGADCIFAGEDGSSVTVDILITDSRGKEVSRVDGVEIAYRQGYLTTVRGEFLTAGKSSGGIRIDTEWEEELEVNF